MKLLSPMLLKPTAVLVASKLLDLHLVDLDALTSSARSRTTPSFSIIAQTPLVRVLAKKNATLPHAPVLTHSTPCAPDLSAIRRVNQLAPLLVSPETALKPCVLLMEFVHLRNVLLSPLVQPVSACRAAMLQNVTVATVQERTAPPVLLTLIAYLLGVAVLTIALLMGARQLNVVYLYLNATLAVLDV